VVRFKQFLVCRSVLLVTTKSHLLFYKILDRHSDIKTALNRKLKNMLLYEYLCAKVCFVSIVPFKIFLSVGTGNHPMRAAGFTPIPLSSIVIR